MTEEAFFPGFCQALVGRQPGETRNFTIEVPADFPVEGMPGQKIDYEVTLKPIMKKVLPELNDDFAGTMATGKTMEELRDDDARGAGAPAPRSGRKIDKRNQIMGHLLSWVECELPDEHGAAGDAAHPGRYRAGKPGARGDGRSAEREREAARRLGGAHRAGAA